MRIAGGAPKVEVSGAAQVKGARPRLRPSEAPVSAHLPWSSWTRPDQPTLDEMRSSPPNSFSGMGGRRRTNRAAGGDDGLDGDSLGEEGVGATGPARGGTASAAPDDAILPPLTFRNLQVKNRAFRSNISGRFDTYNGSDKTAAASSSCAASTRTAGGQSFADNRRRLRAHRPLHGVR